MNDEEKRQFTHMQTDIEHIKISMAGLGNKVDKMYLALMGSDIAKDGGLVGRIEDLEKGVETIKGDIDKIKTEATKSRIYLYLVCVAGGFVLQSAFGYVLSLIFKK